jgi:hypothetical protein
MLEDLTGSTLDAGNNSCNTVRGHPELSGPGAPEEEVVLRPPGWTPPLHSEVPTI